MQKKLAQLLMLSCLLAIGSLTSIAQEKPPRPDESRPQKPGPGESKVPPDGTFKVLTPKIAFGKVVKSAPYSATATTEHIQTLGDGNQIIRKNQSTLYRDSEGRTRIEQTLETIGKWTADGQAQQVIIINDPVTGFNYNLDPRTRTAIKGGGAKIATMKMLDATFTKLRNEISGVPLKKKPPPMGGAPLKELDPAGLKEGVSPDGRRKNEALGKQVIEGIEVEGQRRTLTIPAGEIGNTFPLEVVDETWYSPELQITVMTKHRDPRSGETTYRLFNINRSEPDRSLFEIPADYTVRENKMPLKRKPLKEEE